MIVVTGAAGFIGSCLISKLNQENFNSIIAVDKFDNQEKNKNLEREAFESWLDQNNHEVEFIFHLGARTDTTEFDRALLDKLNTSYSKMVWKKCIDYQIPLVYASSAATYGIGDKGYEDNEEVIFDLKPLNPYGDSKNDFDKWAVKQDKKPFFWAGLKFFNVYGPNEYHKGRMASVVYHAFNQIKKTEGMKLFRSHNPDFKDGEQMRDFIYVDDVTNICYWLMHHRKNSGLYNVGSGQARTFLDLVKAVFAAVNTTEQIGFIDTPEDIRDKYQYFTEANMSKLRRIGYDKEFYALEKGVEEYVKNFLKTQSFH